MKQFYRRFLSLTTVLVAALLVSACSGGGNNNNGTSNNSNNSPNDDLGNIVEVAVGLEGFSTLVTAVQATGLDSVLADESQSFTVFAPTDEAFALLGSQSLCDRFS